MNLRDVLSTPFLRSEPDPPHLRGDATMKGEGSDRTFPCMSGVSDTSLNLERGGPRGGMRREREYPQVTLDPNHGQELSLKSCVSRTPMLFVFVPHLPFLEGRRRIKRNGRQMVKLSFRLRKGRGRAVQAHPGGVEAGLIVTKLLERGSKATEMEGTRLTEGIGEARTGPWGNNATVRREDRPVVRHPNPEATGTGVVLREDQSRAGVQDMVDLGAPQEVRGGSGDEHRRVRGKV